MSVYGTAAAVYENDLRIHLLAVWDEEPHLKDGPLALSCFAKRRTSLLKHGYKVLKAFWNQQKHHKGAARIKSARCIWFLNLKWFVKLLLSTIPGRDASKEKLARS